jgi:hypothetical protein
MAEKETTRLVNIQEGTVPPMLPLTLEQRGAVPPKLPAQPTGNKPSSQPPPSQTPKDRK